jgi:group I intron endonuclease
MKDNNYTVYMHKTPSGKVYIGITKRDPEARWQNGYGYWNNPHFKKAILKYGWDNIQHKILFDNVSKEKACQIEIELIREYKSTDPTYGYNHSIGGSCGSNGLQWDWNRREKLRKANLGKKASLETRLRQSEAAKKRNSCMKGKHHTEKTKAILKEKCGGENNYWFGKHLSNEHKEKISCTKKGCLNYNQGQHLADITKEKIRQKLLKRVICIETGIIYESITDTGIRHVSEACRGKRKTAGGYHWQYVTYV